MLKRIGRWRRSVDVKTIAHYRYEGALILFATHLALPKRGRYLSDLKSNSYLPTAPLSIVRPWCLLILVERKRQSHTVRDVVQRHHQRKESELVHVVSLLDIALKIARNVIGKITSLIAKTFHHLMHQEVHQKIMVL